VSRACFFGFINKHFKLGLEEPVVEEDYDRLTRDEMTVWDVAHPKPEGGPEFERKLCRHLAYAADQQLDALQPKDAASLAKWREVVGGAFETIIGGSVPAKSDLELDEKGKVDGGSFARYIGLLRNKKEGAELPMVLLRPSNWNGRAVIWLAEEGKAALFADDSSPTAEVRRLLDAGFAVFGVDLLYQGEFLPQGEPAEKNRAVKNPREFAGYTYGYNYALLAQRAHDVLTVISFIKNHPAAQPTSIEIIAVDGTAPIAAAALARAEGAVSRAALDTRGFRFGKLTDHLDASFLPGGAKYGDLPGLLSLAAPTKLWLAGETADSAAVAKKAYVAQGAGDAVMFDASKPEDAKRAALEWIIKAQ